MRSMVQDIIAEYRLRYDPLRLSWDRSRTAATIDDILSNLDDGVIERASSVRLLQQERRGPKEVRFKATSGRKTYTVIIRAVEKTDAKRMDRADIVVSCSCPFWRWGGCEHHAKNGQYMYYDGDPVGDLSVPVIRDPENNNFVCKHLYAALQKARKLYIDMDPGRYYRR